MDRKQVIGSIVLILNAIFLVFTFSSSPSYYYSQGYFQLVSIFSIIALLGSSFIMKLKGMLKKQVIAIIFIIVIPQVLLWLPALFLTQYELLNILTTLILITYPIILIFTLIGIYLLQKQ